MLPGKPTSAKFLLLLWMALFGAIQIRAQDGQASLKDVEAIRTLMQSTWGKPDAKLLVEPVVVEGDYALAGWTQGSRGGRALIRRASGRWSVVLCSGDPLRHAWALVEAGVPRASAEHLARELAAAERLLPTGQVALFSTFEGIVHVEDEHHGSAGHH